MSDKKIKFSSEVEVKKVPEAKSKISRRSS